MKLSHARPVRRVVFDEPNLVSAAGLVPVVALADRVGLPGLVDQFLTVPTDKGANAGLKVTSVVAGMVAGADSIDDMAILRHGGMRQIFDACYAPSTLGSFLRKLSFGHVRQLDAVASRTLIGLARQAPLLPGIDEYALADMDDSIIEVHGYAKQGAGFGYTKVRGLNSFIGTVSTPEAAPVIVAQRLRKGSCGSARTYRPDGHGTPAGQNCSPAPADHRQPPPDRNDTSSHQDHGDAGRPAEQPYPNHHPTQFKIHFSNP